MPSFSTVLLIIGYHYKTPSGFSYYLVGRRLIGYLVFYCTLLYRLPLQDSQCYGIWLCWSTSDWVARSSGLVTVASFSSLLDYQRIRKDPRRGGVVRTPHERCNRRLLPYCGVIVRGDVSKVLHKRKVTNLRKTQKTMNEIEEEGKKSIFVIWPRILGPHKGLVMIFF